MFFFFFSSRRRHTRCLSDWSSDVCSSDLPVSSDMADNARKWWLQRPESLGGLGAPDSNPEGYRHLSPRNYFEAGQPPVRSEERRVGKECRARRSAEP